MAWKIAGVQLDAGSYYLRLYDDTQRRKIKLGRESEFTTRTALEAAAQEMRVRHRKISSRTITLKQFTRWFYLPVAQQHVRRITYLGYKTIYDCHIAPRREADSRLVEFTTGRSPSAPPRHRSGTVADRYDDETHQGILEWRVPASHLHRPLSRSEPSA